MEFDKIEKFEQQNKIDLVVIGPEDPLAMGLTDLLPATGLKSLRPFQGSGPDRSGKWFAKEIMRQQSVPTAEARVFTDAAAADEYIRIQERADGHQGVGPGEGKGRDGVLFR